MASYVDENGVRHESYRDSSGKTKWRAVQTEGGTVVGGATVAEGEKAFRQKAAVGTGTGVVSGALMGAAAGTLAGPGAVAAVPIGAIIGAGVGLMAGGGIGAAMGQKAEQDILESAEDRLKREQEEEAEAQKKAGAQALAAKEQSRTLPAGSTNVLANNMPTEQATKGVQGGAASYYQRQRDRFGHG